MTTPLDLVRSALTTYVSYPSPEAADAHALWIAATHAQPVWDFAPRLVLKSPQKRCGKTRAQEVASEMCHAPLKTANISVAALVRSINAVDPPTIFVDEGDAIFNKSAKGETAEALRGILNAGAVRGWPYTRWDVSAAGGGATVESPTFAMASLSGIGNFPDTIEDRAVVIIMQRRQPNDYVTPYRQRLRIPLNQIRDAIHGWIRGAPLNESPTLPVEDRAADVWEPLVSIADFAGEDWPDRARRACLSLTQEAEDDAAGMKLLADLRAIFDTCGHAHLFSADIIEELRKFEESPWKQWDYNTNQLARTLKPYGLHSKQLRAGERNAKGYSRSDLEPVWTRYLGEAS